MEAAERATPQLPTQSLAHTSSYTYTTFQGFPEDLGSEACSHGTLPRRLAAVCEVKIPGFRKVRELV